MDKKKKFYFLGIGGLGMSSVAGLLKQAGYEVTGSDGGMSEAVRVLLSELDIPVKNGFSEQNILEDDSDVYVIGNSLSRGHVEVEAVLDSKRNYSCFPEVLEDYFLDHKRAIVVCGTHGKSTTSTWISLALESLGLEPSYMIGAIPSGKTRSSRYGSGEFFVLEGDEYDTAFYDKGSKFLHYKPEFVVLNNIEFDHADIFKDLEAIYSTFSKLLALVKDKGNVIANIDDSGVYTLLKRLNLLDQVYKVSPYGLKKEEADLCFLEQRGSDPVYRFQEKEEGELELKVKLPGDYNRANGLQSFALLNLLRRKGLLKKKSTQDLCQALGSFSGVQKRLENLGFYQGAQIYRDFGHHPTAIEGTLKNLRSLYPKKRIVAGFEPKNATSRRNTFSERYKEVFKEADLSFFTLPPDDKRLKDNEKMDIFSIQESLTEAKASVLESKDAVKDWCHKTLKEGDVCVFFSCSEFMNIPVELANSMLSS